MKFGVIIRSIRKDMKLSQVELSQIMGVSQPTLSKIERDQGSPDAIGWIQIYRYAIRQKEQRTFAQMNAFMRGEQ